ncbi:MAG: carbohydrate ABC transporter permease [Oscillospiraceae bacterium]|jgi:putative aldouronate transport system permease protein|nr:carbohydrate ABC transporter permease [Oscillospiraceae bacterium]
MRRRFTISQALTVAVVSLIAIFCLTPMLMVLMTSFATERAITVNGYTLWPAEWSGEAYRRMFNSVSKVPKAYWVTIRSTLAGTLAAVVMSYCAGYTLSCPQCKFRNGLALYFYITMIFSAGLVPWYMVNRALGLTDNIWALIVPSLMFSPFNMYLVRNFLRGVPDSLRESGLIDGAGEARIAFTIYLPLATPVLATITLFYAISYWNNYFNAVMLVNKADYYPLQMLLFNIQSELSMISNMMTGVSLTPPKESFKMATSIITIGPIILVYPFLQRYFIKGMVVGAVKG